MSVSTDRLTIEDAVRVLGARREGRGWRARCPVHAGDGWNLAIDAAADGAGPVFYCHSHQCDTRAILAAVRERARCAGHPAGPDGTTAGRGQPTQTHVYRDGAGAVVGEVRRWDLPGGGKTFRQYAPDGTPKAPPALRTTPYRLQAVRAAAAIGGTVFVVEGEKCVDALAAVGVVATCNTEGAGKWKPEHAREFAGARRVVVLPDNDDQGRKHARGVVRSLLALAHPPEVYVVHLPGLGPKGDVADWLCNGGTAEHLDVLARGVLPVRAQTVDAACGLGDGPAAAPDDAPATPGLPRAIRLLDAEEEPLPVWLVTNLLPAREPVLFAGEGGSMKTTILLHLAVAVAAGGLVFGLHPVVAGSVLIVSGEDSLGVIQNRVRAIAKGHGWAWERVAAHLHIIALGGADLARSAGAHTYSPKSSARARRSSSSTR